MNKFFASIAVAASAFALASCSNDEPIVDGGANKKPVVDGNMYTSLTLSLPQASKSSTIPPTGNTNSSDGYEIGQDYENNVGSVLVVLATKVDDGKYTYVTSNLADAQLSSPENASKPTYNVQFETRVLYDMAGYTKEDGTTVPSQQVYVFAYCNPTTTLVKKAAEEAVKVADGIENEVPYTSNWDFVNEIGKITDSSISVKNGFLMSNATTPVPVSLPTQDDMDHKYNTPNNPYFLGTIDVQRATARFDFKQTKLTGMDVANKYPIYNHVLSTENNDGPLQGYVVLDGMALQNEAISYYFLSRTNSDGKNENMNICFPENPNNYVVSPFADEKSEGSLDVKWIRNNYLYNAQPESGDVRGAIFENLKYESLDITKNDEDDDNHWGPNDQGIAGYNIWRYVTENTIPSPTSLQRNGITTAVIFRGHLEGEEGSDLAKAMAPNENGTYNPIYAYNGIIYGNLSMLKAAVKANPVSALAETFKAAYDIEGEITDEALDGVTKDLEASNGFAIYRPVTDKETNVTTYPVYYPYYNRHNDNTNNTVMGIMEFGVVRNNIYKLAVTNVLEFGHPGNPGDDPDPEDPDDPDETPKTYFRVQVRVLPWVVRVNNIIL
ncbi:MAG: Mfa1 family fimbria major subunit [Paenibacillus sp.]|nr:Mfa1 family fimbria major subunit [Paenibacillus sp.]